ncbi:hypothetical protein DSO57_1032121 [Entomophthora muscae]|uniref:Uncharacterized protein n=1 Tax=Entomophthora muscae TaxID=34485 RepID=A0ACC2UMF3_9FUNG|nr:hypothetical protein DSO57_1032121 [Entomophthora muscae]
MVWVLATIDWRIETIGYVINVISILVLKTQELNPSSLKVDQTLQNSPGPTNPLSHRLKSLNYSATCQPTTEDPLNGFQTAAKPVPMKTHTYKGDVVWLTEVGEGPTFIPVNLPSANTGVLKSTLETLKSNSDPLNTTQVTQSGRETAHLLNYKPKLTSYSKTRQSPKDNSPNCHQIDANLEPPKIQTYAEVVACLKKVKTKPIIDSANDHQQLPAFHPEWVVQLNYSGDIVNSGGRTKHCHFYSPEQAQPGSAALKTLSQDPCPASALSANLNPVKIKEAKSQVIFHLNSIQVDHQATAPSGDQPADPTQALYHLPGAPFRPVHFTKYPPNLAYVGYNLETILIADPLASTRETEYIGREGKWYKRPPRLFKDKYNYLPAYFVPMTPPLTPRPDHPIKTPTAAETMSTQLFGVLYITLTGMVDFMVPTSGPWSLLGRSMSYIIKLAPILWWALPASLVQPHPKPPNASTYAWLPDRLQSLCIAKKGTYLLGKIIKR